MKGCFSMKKENLKQYVKRVWNDCINLEIKSPIFIKGIISATILSLITTPFIGVPLGMMITSHFVQKSNNKQ